MADQKASPGSFLYNNAVIGALRDVWSSYSARREALGLPNPGTTEGIAREVEDGVFLSRSMFTGLRADLTKSFSATPLFQVSHGFAMGAQGLPPYTFSGLYGTEKVFMQGNIDNEGALSARANYKWTPSFVTKTNVQVAPGAAQAMLQLDNDYTGKDFTASLKSLNPSILEGGLTGILVGSYMQSVTPSLALGLEAVWQRQAVNMGPESVVNYCAKYRGNDWIASANLQAQGALKTSYWRRLSDKVEAGVDMNLGLGSRGGGLMGGGLQREGVTTLGAKWDYRASSFRAQVDSTGKISCLLEKSIAPAVRVTFAGDMDHSKNQAKIGLAVSIEASSEEMMEIQERTGAPPAPPAIPF